MIRPPHPPRLERSTFTWRGVQITKLLVRVYIIQRDAIETGLSTRVQTTCNWLMIGPNGELQQTKKILMRLINFQKHIIA
jgi:hypothetical protein